MKTQQAERGVGADAYAWWSPNVVFWRKKIRALTDSVPNLVRVFHALPIHVFEIKPILNQFKRSQRM